MLNLLFLAEEIAEEIPSIDTTAVDKLFEWIQKILNTQLMTIGGTTLTVGLLIVMIIKWFFPKNKIIANQETEIENLEIENQLLKERAELQEARIQTLEAKMNVVTDNVPNKKVRDAGTIEIKPNEINRAKVNATKDAQVKKVKVKVKKSANNLLNEAVVENGI